MGGIGTDFSFVLAGQFLLLGLAAIGMIALVWFLVRGV